MSLPAFFPSCRLQHEIDVDRSYVNVATALRQRVAEFLLNTDQTNIFAKIIAERQDTNKMQTFHLAA